MLQCYLQEKFISLALAFKTDKMTLDKRIELHERSRDIAEQNVENELDGLREALKVSGMNIFYEYPMFIPSLLNYKICIIVCEILSLVNFISKRTSI